MDEVRTCMICGKKFIQGKYKKRMKYCSAECRREARLMHMREKDGRDRARRAADNGMGDITTGKLDERLAEARARGMSYAELQKEKTIQKVRRGEL